MNSLTSLTNPLVKAIARLQDEPRHRRKMGLFCVESDRELRRALQQGFTATHVLVDDPRLLDDELQRHLTTSNAQLLHVTPQIIQKLAYRENPQGLLAVLQARTASLDDIPAGPSPLFIVCSGLEKPGNIGAILRSADAAAATAVLIDAEDFDVFNPNCIRASTGAVFHVPIVLAPAPRLIEFLKARAVPMLALTPEAAAPYTQADLTRGCAFVLGAEAQGLSEEWKAAADERIAIPMRGVADSLNVSVTAAVLLFEALRQRT